MSGAAFAVELKEVSLAYGSGKERINALNGISACMVRGQITGIMGPDAAGKTTLMRIMAGLLLPESGDVRVFGSPIDQLKKRIPNCIGYMPQRFGLYEDLTVGDNLNLYADLRGVADKDKPSVFERLLKFTGLAPFTNRLAGNLSGGMKQKLGIACALLGNPDLLLLDEPGVGVDPRSRRELWEMVGELAADGITVVWATSYLDEAARCPSLIVLESGKLLFSGQPAQLSHRAAGNVYLLKEKSDGAEKRADLAFWTVAPGIVDVLIQGDYIRLGTDGQKNTRQTVEKAGAIPAQPDLGDAYIAAVGGIDKRPSPYASIGHIGDAKDSDRRIVARDLTKKFGNFTAANNITFKVAAGEILGLLGPNGAGKSTTFRMLCGLLKPTSGTCSVDGVDMLKSSSQARNRIGYMAQKFSLYLDITVWENILISARLYGLSRQRIRDMGIKMAEALDLEPYLKSRTRSLPLGLKQRLALLCATLHEPPVLFLDEPTSGVDVRTRRDFWKHISALTNAGTAVLVTTHFMEEAEYCDHIALIYRSNMIRYGTPNQLRSGVTGRHNPTMEDAFISYIEEYDREHPL